MLQPIVTEQLLAKLRDVFPSVPSRSMTIREVDYLIGQQEVISYIERLLDEDNRHGPLDLEGL